MSDTAVNVPARDDRPSGGRSLAQRLLLIDEIGVIGALAVLIVLLSLLAGDKFLTAQNFINVSRQASYVGIMAVGMVFVIAMGDIDLSVGSIWMLSSVMMAIALRDNYSIWVAVAVCLVVATLCGLVNGALSVALGIPTIIVTLGTLSLYRGLGLVVSNASPVSGYNLDTWFFTWIGGRDPVFGVWISVWVMLIVGILGWVLFNHTPFGRRVQAIGSNRQAALFSGIRIARTRIMVMTLMGFIVGIAAVVALAFNRNGSPTVGVGTELGVIAATIIGGTALSGGSGSVLGAILGALIIALIQNGLALLAVPPAWSTAVTGIVIIVAVTLDYFIKRRA
ncbi:MAG: ABC transporter permease [Thermomicrobiales bacterium]|nr:ABC transporter permease [Thermomicrobiales bacterium]